MSFFFRNLTRPHGNDIIRSTSNMHRIYMRSIMVPSNNFYPSSVVTQELAQHNIQKSKTSYYDLDFRTFGTTTDEEKETKGEENAEEIVEDSSNDEENSEDLSPSTEELQKEISNLKDQLLRSLAEQENIRRIAKKDVQSSKNYAVSSFAKSLLDTHDNLHRAMEAVPEEMRSDHENHKVLANLYEGIKMTDVNFTKAFKKNNLLKYGEVGDKFDPNIHNALFEYEDDTKPPGTIGQVMKNGFMLNNRVLRPAEVGTVKKV